MVLDVLAGEDLNDIRVLDEHPLPDNFTPERVRILTQDTRYTWMMTVRNSGGVASINVVVFFRRSFETADEYIHSSTTALSAFRKDSNLVVIDYTTPKPYLRKGSYVFDHANGYWYRIQDFVDDGVGHVNITIEQPALESSNQAILLKDIVEVFPIEAVAP